MIARIMWYMSRLTKDQLDVLCSFVFDLVQLRKKAKKLLKSDEEAADSGGKEKS